MALNVLATLQALSPANLTVRETARLAENPLDLRYQGIFPNLASDSIRLREITNVDFRPVGGRREWNAQGREIHEVIGPVVDATMIPINPTHHIDEERMQLLREPGVQALVARGLAKDVDRWATTLADVAERQTERDAFETWFTNALSVKDTKTSASVTVSAGVATDRYVTEGTAWSDASVNSYDRTLFHIGEYIRKAGSIGGIRMRAATAQQIVADAPNGAGLVRPTLANVAARLSEEGFGTVQLIIDERTYDEYTDGGSAYTSKFYVPANRIAFQPANGQVGNTYNAPVTRAEDYGVPASARSARGGVTVFYRGKNDGKTIMVEAQKNCVTLLNPQSVYVVATGA